MIIMHEKKRQETRYLIRPVQIGGISLPETVGGELVFEFSTRFDVSFVAFHSRARKGRFGISSFLSDDGPSEAKVLGPRWRSDYTVGTCWHSCRFFVLSESSGHGVALFPFFLQILLFHITFNITMPFNIQSTLSSNYSPLP